MNRFRLAYRILLGFFLLVVGVVFLPSRQPDTLALYATTQEKIDPLHPVETFTTHGSATTLNDAFTQAGKTYFPEDIVGVTPDLSYGLGSVITVKRAMPVTIIDGKRTYAARTWQTTVEDLLKEKNIDLADQDKISLAPSETLTANSTVAITRVARTTKSLYEVIPFQVVKQDDPTTYRGSQTVTQTGQNGQRKIDHLIIREDGELKSDTITGTSVVTKVVNQIIKVGTKLKLGPAVSGKATFYVNSLGTKVATDKYKKGAKLLVTNLNNGKKIEVVNDGCICGNSSVLIDLNPSYFQQLGGTLGQGVLQSIKVEEILN